MPLPLLVRLLGYLSREASVIKHRVFMARGQQVRDLPQEMGL